MRKYVLGLTASSWMYFNAASLCSFVINSFSVAARRAFMAWRRTWAELGACTRRLCDGGEKAVTSQALLDWSSIVSWDTFSCFRLPERFEMRIEELEETAVLEEPETIAWREETLPEPALWSLLL